MNVNIRFLELEFKRSPIQPYFMGEPKFKKTKGHIQGHTAN